MAVTAVTGRRQHTARARQVTRKGIARNRADYDRRRRLSTRSDETRAYMALIRHDPCAFCGVRPRPGRVQDVDHIVPLSDGGLDTWENMAAVCPGCNRGRKAKTLLETLTWRIHARRR